MSRPSATKTSRQAVGLPVGDAGRLAPRVLRSGTLVRLFLLDVNVLALPHVPHYVAEHGGEVMVAAPTEGGSLPQLTAADYATEALTLGMPHKRGAAQERSALIFGQATT